MENESSPGTSDHYLDSEENEPKRNLSVFDSTCLIVGTIVGSGIFITAKMTASNVADVYWLIAAWIFGGMIALVGALCLSELATTYSKTGGDYIFLSKAYGKSVGFLFVWSEFWIVRAGNIGMMAVTAAIYANEIYPLNFGKYSDLPYACGFVLVLGMLNLIGVKFGKTFQNTLTVLKISGLILIVVVAFAFTTNRPDPVLTRYVADDGEISSIETKQIQRKLSNESGEFKIDAHAGLALRRLNDRIEEDAKDPTWKTFYSKNIAGKVFKKTPPVSLMVFPFAMLFVMFTFGGWNDLAFVAGEVKNPKRNFVRSLVYGILVVTFVYVLVNLAYVHALGLKNVANPESRAIASDLMKVKFASVVGNSAAWVSSKTISIIVCLCCLGAINAMIFTGSRIYYASGRDHATFRWLGKWNTKSGIPARSILAQTFIALALILICGRDREGFERLLAVTGPFFWIFFFLVAVSLFVSRWRDPNIDRPFKAPLFPLTPILFCAANAFMIYNTAKFAIAMKYFESFFAIGIVVLGIIVWIIQQLYDKKTANS